MIPYEIRGAVPSDEEDLLRVAHHLNTVNLPDDRDAIRGILDQSQRSFTGQIKDPKRREYVFVLIDRAKDELIGTSMIIAQLGRRDAPYIYLDVIDEERYSATLDRHFKHTTLSIGYSYNGPTEIGGLILQPDYRKVPEQLGLFISYVRFLYLKMHRDLFRDEVLAELLPPLEPDGTSHLWDALGRHFTGLTYAEADRLSKKNKEFIRGLFPEGTIYASLLPQQAQDVIGKVGAPTRGVEKMLRRIGFRYAERVDPFDGGPHFTALMDEVSLVQRTRKLRLTRAAAGEPVSKRRALIGVDLAESPHFRSVWTTFLPLGEDAGVIEAAAADLLGVAEGGEAWVLPLEGSPGSPDHATPDRARADAS
jgi:arginine N-succinyltransferase